MLDLFKNIINRKSKEQKEKEDQEFQEDHTDQHSQNDQSSSINLILEIHPELSDYYAELHKRYLLSDKIGEGAFSSVYKAYDSKESRYLAIKIINKSNMKQEQINSTLKEIAIMRQLDHPNIVNLYNYQNSSDSKYCFLFLEFISGGEIFNQIIKYTYFSENLTRHILRQVAFAVKYLHDNGIVHRDIKPENLLFEPSKFIERSKSDQLKARRVSDDNNKVDEGVFSIENGSAGIGVVKLADFGLSTFLQSSNELAKTPCGTVGYTSPEQHMNVGYDKKVDMWAIGCVLYTMVVGFPPFYSNNQDANDITEKVMKGEYQFLKPWFDEVSIECKNLISNLLTVDPIKRYSIDQLLLDPWFNKGYEKDNKILKTQSSPADDAPILTYDNELYKTFSESLINNSNVGDYFTGNKITCDEGPIITPRAEAIKLVFDTATDFKNRQRNTSSTSSLKNRSSVSPMSPILKINRQMGAIDFICLNPPERKYSLNSDSLSDLESDASYDHVEYSDGDYHHHSLERFSQPISIHANDRNSELEKENVGDEDEDDKDDGDDGDDYDDESLDLEFDDDTDDYPITLTSLTKTRSPMIKRTHAIESSTSSCLSPAHSHGTTVTLTTQTTTRAPSFKSLNEAVVDAINENNKNSQVQPARKTSISFSIDSDNNKRSGSITSNNSLSDLSVSNSIVTSPSSIISTTNISKIGHFNDLNKVDETDEDGNDDDKSSDNTEWDDKTPLPTSKSNCMMHQLNHSEFRAKCQAHTPYIFKGNSDSIEDEESDNSVSLEEKMSQHGVMNLQLNTSTILSRRKQKVEEGS